jgi:hypothetical protein
MSAQLYCICGSKIAHRGNRGGTKVFCGDCADKKRRAYEAEYRRTRGKRHRTSALGTEPLEQEPDANGASPASIDRDRMEL